MELPQYFTLLINDLLSPLALQVNQGPRFSEAPKGLHLVVANEAQLLGPGYLGGPYKKGPTI